MRNCSNVLEKIKGLEKIFLSKIFKMFLNEVSCSYQGCINLIKHSKKLN